jgi:hypothetical protein
MVVAVLGAVIRKSLSPLVMRQTGVCRRASFPATSGRETFAAIAVLTVVVEATCVVACRSERVARSEDRNRVLRFALCSRNSSRLLTPPHLPAIGTPLAAAAAQMRLIWNISVMLGGTLAGPAVEMPLCAGWSLASPATRPSSPGGCSSAARLTGTRCSCQGKSSVPVSVNGCGEYAGNGCGVRLGMAMVLWRKRHVAYVGQQ